jgi:hypothetical protein
MNSVMEWFFESVSREALDNFLLFGANQIGKNPEEYVAFYNCQQPHLGIQQQMPKPSELEKKGGAVCRRAVLGGLHHHLCRKAA